MEKNRWKTKKIFHLGQILLLLVLLLFTNCNSDSFKPNDKYIAIQPFNKIENKTYKAIKQIVEEIYNKEVIVLPERPLPNHAFVNIKSPRYRADTLLRYLRTMKPDSVAIIVGYTNKDISCTKKGFMKKPEYRDWGIFGLGKRPGSCSMVSSFRVGNTSPKNKLERIKKVIVHEIGHNYGLKHCPDKKCVMTDAVESIKTVDNAKLALCEKCKKSIK